MKRELASSLTAAFKLATNGVPPSSVYRQVPATTLLLHVVVQCRSGSCQAEKDMRRGGLRVAPVVAELLGRPMVFVHSSPCE